jgi:type IV pilus assembly protein PilC
MQRFAYNAVTQAGEAVSGVVEAESAENAGEILSRRGELPTRIRADRGSGGVAEQRLNALFNKVRAQDLILFTKQFGTMLRTGVPVVQAMGILETQSENKRLAEVSAAIEQDIREGANLSVAMRKFPDVFSELYVSMVRAGETSGALPEVLDRLIYVIDHENRVKSDIRAALSYPLLVLGCLVVAFGVLLGWVVPKFVSVFENADLILPLPTRICLALSHFLVNHGLVFVVMLVGITALSWAALRTERGRLARDTALLNTPLIGPVLLKAAISRFASIFAILQATGVAILDAMSILSGTIGNAAVGRQLATIQTRLQEGRGIAAPLRSARYFPPLLINMVAIGEETGNLDEMLREVAKHYDTEVEYATKRMSDAIGPILIVSLAAVVGFFALAIYLPMWDLMKIAGQ